MTTQIQTCAHENMITDHETGDMVCTTCGMVTGQDEHVMFSTSRVSTSSDKRTGERNTDYPVTSTLARHDKGMGTTMDRIVYGQGRTDAKVLAGIRLWDMRIRCNGQRVAIESYNLLETIASKLAITQAVKEKAAYIFRRASARGMMRGVSHRTFIAACIYISMRETSLPVSLLDIASIIDPDSTRATMRKISILYRKIILGLEIKVPVQEPASFVARVSGKLGLDEKTVRAVRKNIAAVSAAGISHGKNPVCLAAAVTWLTTSRDIQQMVVARAYGITEVSVRNIVKEIREKSPGISIEYHHALAGGSSRFLSDSL